MEGGVFFKNGADTCVFKPPVACEEPGKDFTGRTDRVSRVVMKAKSEWNIQVALKKHFEKIKPRDPDIEKYFNVADDHCEPKFKPEDRRYMCEVEETKLTLPRNLDNLITPIQKEDLGKTLPNMARAKPREKIRKALGRLILAAAELNARGFIHDDSHFGNIAWMGEGDDERLVLHDWGRARNGDDAIDRKIDRLRKLQKDDPDEYFRIKLFPQHLYIYNFIDNSKSGLPGLGDTPGSCDWRRKDRMKLFARGVWDTFGILGCAARNQLVTGVELRTFFKGLGEWFGNPVKLVADGDKEPNRRDVRKCVLTLIRAMFDIPRAADAPRHENDDLGENPLENIHASALAGGADDDVDSNPEGEPLTKEEAAALLAPMDDLDKAADEAGKCAIQGGRRSLFRKKTQMKTRMSSKFGRCVKSVRKTVRARKGSNKESAAIAICTKSVLQKRGRTIRSYRKGHLRTQKKFRGGDGVTGQQVYMMQDVILQIKLAKDMDAALENVDQGFVKEVLPLFEAALNKMRYEKEETFKGSFGFMNKKTGVSTERAIKALQQLAAGEFNGADAVDLTETSALAAKLTNAMQFVMPKGTPLPAPIAVPTSPRMPKAPVPAAPARAPVVQGTFFGAPRSGLL